MPGGPSMTSTPPRPCTSAVSSAPITFSSPARPRIGGVTSWPPTSNRPVGGPTGCPVYRLLTATAVHVIVGVRPRRPPTSSARFVVDRSARTRSGTAPRRRQPNISGGRPPISGDCAGNQDRQFIGALLDRFRHFGDLFLHLVAWHGRKINPKPRPCHC